jgi:hypothetical protein
MTFTAQSPSPVATVEFLAERCDGCGAAAKVGFELATGGSLALCGHHANRMADEIARVALRIDVEEGFDWAGAPV